MIGEDAPPVVRLDDETVERLARRVAELLDHPPPRRPAGQRLLSAAQVSAWCGVDRSWVYEHADELGALRLGTGPKPRLRFDPDRVVARLSPPTAVPPPADPPKPQHAPRFRALPGDSSDPLPLRADPELSSTRPATRRPGDAPTPPATAPRTRPSAR